MRLRQIYYNIFSNFYDFFIKIHSRDKQEKLREFLVNSANLKSEYNVLDLCCGTGSNFSHLSKKIKKGMIVGIDFSIGMLKKAKQKTSNVLLIYGDIQYLPFKSESFDIITYTYAFYELEAEKVDYALMEIKRVLKPRGKLLIMEHEIPRKKIIRFLYYIRLASMGLKKAKRILSSELDYLKKIFPSVEKIITPSGNSKIIICTK